MMVGNHVQEEEDKRVGKLKLSAPLIECTGIFSTVAARRNVLLITSDTGLFRQFSEVRLAAALSARVSI